MGAHYLNARQNVPIDIDTAWKFLSDPRNLSTITPPDMGFQITSKDLPEKMYPGMVITYKVSPCPGFKTTWVTEITQVKEPEYFIDNQRTGPYQVWHHQHFLKEIPGGVQMDDKIHYVAPFAILGDIANALIIKSKLRKIFEYRKTALEKKFGIMDGGFIELG
ncbi:MAG: SRPBCC family protein [Candidatus Kapaibacteriales bacterium]